MVVPRVERRGPAGLVVTAATATGMSATDESLLRGAARAALATGVPVSSGPAPTPWSRSRSPWARGCPPTGCSSPAPVSRPPRSPCLGAYVVLTDPHEVVALAAAGHAEQGPARHRRAGLSVRPRRPARGVRPFVTALPDDIAHQVLVANPRDLLAVKER